MLEALRNAGVMHIDSISENVGMEQGFLSEVLLKLELKDLIKVSAGKNYIMNEIKEN